MFFVYFFSFVFSAPPPRTRIPPTPTRSINQRAVIITGSFIMFIVIATSIAASLCFFLLPKGYWTKLFNKIKEKFKKKPKDEKELALLTNSDENDVFTIKHDDAHPLLNAIQIQLSQDFHQFYLEEESSDSYDPFTHPNDDSSSSSLPLSLVNTGEVD